MLAGETFIDLEVDKVRGGCQLDVTGAGLELPSVGGKNIEGLPNLDAVWIRKVTVYDWIGVCRLGHIETGQYCLGCLIWCRLDKT